MLLPGRIYIELGPWHFGIFGIFSSQIQVKTKKILSFEHGAPGTVCVKTVKQMLNPAWFLHYAHKKVRWGHQLATLKIKTLISLGL